MIHCYKLCGHNIVLDVASGSVHSVDDVVYDVILMYAAVVDSGGAVGGEARGVDSGGAVRGVVGGGERSVVDDKARSAIIARILEKHADKTESDVRAIIDDIEKLINRGKLFSVDNFERATAPNGARCAPNGAHCAANTPDGGHCAAQDGAIKALCLNVSHACNMSCAYCFAHESLNTPSSLMTAETGRQAIDFLIKNSGKRKNLDIDFFGGEPLLNLSTIKDIVAYAREVEKKTDKKFRFTLTTNGLLIDDDVIAFTNKEIHNVVLSLDGRQQVHDKMRKLQDGTGSYDEVLPRIKNLVEKRRHKGYYIRGTFTRENMDFVNDILHLSKLGFTELSLEPAVTKRGDPTAFTKDDLSELFRQYDVLAVEMKRRADNAVFVRPSDIPTEERQFNFYHYNLDLENAPCVHKRIAGCGVATDYMAVTPSGELYPCHQFIGEKACLLGDVWSGVTNRSLREKFAAVNIYSRKECRACWARFYCSGGCAANAYHASGSIDGLHEIGCELFKKRIENAIMLKF